MRQRRRIVVELISKRPSVLVSPLVAVGALPSVVYRKVAPLGIVTCTVKLLLKTRLSVSTTGASSLKVAKLLVVLVAPGVELLV